MGSLLEKIFIDSRLSLSDYSLKGVSNKAKECFYLLRAFGLFRKRRTGRWKNIP
jgi:hypothetical protein